MMQSQNEVAVRYNGNQLDGLEYVKEQKLGFQHVTINIDYLIINLVGTLANVESNYIEHLEIIPNDYGTKVFSASHKVLYHGITMGNILSVPRSEILDKQLCQFQFENHLFYINDLSELKRFVYEFTEITGLRFSGVNRLDIAVDCSDTHGFFSSVITGILNRSFKIAGRTKNFSLHYETHEGESVLNGYSVGKRTSSRYLRVYNKSLEMRSKPKGYIRENWVANGIEPWDVWRFEYQLNNTFFRGLKEIQNHDDLPGFYAEQEFTWSIFDRANLVKLLALAQKNHFDIRFNTGKAETNKEKEFRLFDWHAIEQKIDQHKRTCLKRLERKLDVSDVAVKRAVKGMLREYYNSGQDLTFMLPVNRILLTYKEETTKTVLVNQYNPYSGNNDKLAITLRDDSLESWLMAKMPYYIAEFAKKAVKPCDFDYSKYRNHLNVFI